MRKWALLSVLVLAVGCSSSGTKASAQGPDASHKGDTSAAGGGDAGDASQGDASPSVPATINPHWCFMTGDGKPVRAIVEKVEAGAPSRTGDFNYLADKPIYVKLHAIGSIILPNVLTYDLGQGELQAGSIAEGSLFLFYGEPTCSGSPLYIAVTQYSIVKVNGELYVPSGTPVSPSDLYTKSAGQCTKVTNAVEVRKLVPVPPAVVNALPNPPYEVRPTY